MVAQNPAPIISWLIVDDDSLFLGGGVPKMFGEWAGSNEGHGMYAYALKQ